MAIYNGDPSFKNPILISSIPPDPDNYSYFNTTLGANTQLVVSWTTTPTRPQLSLWDFLVSVRFGADDAAHNYPNGSSLTVNQSLVEVTMYTDAIQSDDNTNMRYTRVIMKNTSADSFTSYMYFKSYSFTTSVGSTG